MQEVDRNMEDSDDEDDEDPFFDVLEEGEHQLILNDRVGIHEPLFLPGFNTLRPRSGCAPLPYGTLMFKDNVGVCICDAFIHHNFERNGICCAMEGGQFWDYLTNKGELHQRKVTSTMIEIQMITLE